MARQRREVAGTRFASGGTAPFRPRADGCQLRPTGGGARSPHAAPQLQGLPAGRPHIWAPRPGRVRAAGLPPPPSLSQIHPQLLTRFPPKTATTSPAPCRTWPEPSAQAQAPPLLPTGPRSCSCSTCSRAHTVHRHARHAHGQTRTRTQTHRAGSASLRPFCLQPLLEPTALPGLPRPRPDGKPATSPRLLQVPVCSSVNGTMQPAHRPGTYALPVGGVAGVADHLALRALQKDKLRLFSLPFPVWGEMPFI